MDREYSNSNHLLSTCPVEPSTKVTGILMHYLINFCWVSYYMLFCH